MSEENYNKTSIQGRRVEPPVNVDLAVDAGDLLPGDYFKDADGWKVVIPSNVYPSQITGNPNNLTNWSVTEHPDGTITVSPSIHCVGHWHGFLQNGFWRSC